jgi:hypothetical protein
MHLGTFMARCRRCDDLFSFDRARARLGVAGGAAESPDDSPSAGDGLPRPPGMKVERLPNVWRVSWRWFRADYLGLLAFCIFWDGFLVFWYTVGLTTGGPPMMFVFPLLHVAVGVYLTYYVLTGLLNRTTVELTPHELVIAHAPLPWAGNRRLPVSRVGQLYCEEANFQRNDRKVYRLSAVLAGGDKVILLSGFADLGEPRFLKHELERRIGIVPRPVVGECRD